MDNGTDSGDCVVVPLVRLGLKREFAFALQAQSEMSGSLGRTRGIRKNGNNGLGDEGEMTLGLGGPIWKGEKRVKVSSPDSDNAAGDIGGNVALEGAVSEEDAKSDVVNGEDVGSECMENDLVTEASGENNIVNEVPEGMENCGVIEEVLADAVSSVKDKNADFGECVSLIGEANTGGVKAFIDRAIDRGSEKGKNGAVNERKESMLSTGLVDVPVIVGEVKPKEDGIQVEMPDGKMIANRDVGKLQVSGTPVKLEMKMSKKITLRRPFVSLKDFLDSGLLEGYHVTYCRGLKGTRQKEKSLEGVIKGNGILCFCDKCKATKNVVVPTVFELHAGSPNKRPPEYIYLDNGRTLRDVMNAVKNSSADIIEQAVQAVIGCDVLNRCSLCLSCRGRMTNTDSRGTELLCSQCLELKGSVISPVEVMESCSSELMCREKVDSGPIATSLIKTAESTLPIVPAPVVKTLTKTAEMTLPIKSESIVKPLPQKPESMLAIVDKTEATSSAGSLKSTAKTKIQGKLTRKDLSLHRLIFEEDVLPDGTEVAYFSHGQKMLVGYKKGFGIVCSCCDSEVSPSQFEAHAGWASRRKPYLHIYTSNGVSLHELSVNLNKQRKFSNSENDDVCSSCLNGGDVLCCDTCPRSYHLECIALRSLPHGRWSYRICVNLRQQEKFINIDSLAAGRNAEADPIEQITKRCIRIVSPPETEVGGCALCRGHGFTRSGFGPKTVIICDQCEKEFHISCLRDHGMADLRELPEGDWFCGMDCERINCTLKKLVAHGEEKLTDSLMDVVRKKVMGRNLQSSSDMEIRWRILNSKMDSSDESRQLLSHSIKIFHDRFAPIAETSARRDLIPAMVYGKSYKGQEFSGMFCVILTVNHAVVSTGLLRIFGDKVAELPLVATVTDCQGQGYFQSLFRSIEELLGRLNVKDLVLPAAEETKSIWINRFGFGKVEEEEVNELRKNYPMMIFQGTTVLKKAVPALSDLGREPKP